MTADQCNLSFVDFLENGGFNASGRAGQHVWKPESPVTHDTTSDSGKRTQAKVSNRKLNGSKTIDIRHSYKPQAPASFKSLTARDFGSKITKVPKPKI